MKKLKILYFGIYRSDFGRNKVYITGLRQNGIEITECLDDSSGLKKYWKLWKKYRLLEKDYDFILVGYPGYMIVPFAKLISKKPIIFDALCTLYEGEIISREKYKFNPLMRVWIILIDWVAVKCADLVLVETNAQKEYFIKKFSLYSAADKGKKDKVVRIFTGVDETIFYNDPSIKKRTVFTAVFRGRLLPEAGSEYIVQAAKLLENDHINFLIIGGGLMEGKLESLVKSLKLRNLEWTKEYLSSDELRRRILECHVSIGQVSNHERLARTIPHKAFETLSMSMPYVTSRTACIGEVFTDKENCLLVEQANAKDLAMKIKELKNNPDLASRIAKKGKELYDKQLTPAVLGRDILNALGKNFVI